MNIANGMKILENYRGNRLEFVEKFKIINIWRILSIMHLNLRNYLQSFARLDQKWRKFWKIVRKFWGFYSESLWKIDFSLFLLHISRISASSPKVYTHMEDYTSFYNNISDFGRGDVQAFPFPTLQILNVCIFYF